MKTYKKHDTKKHQKTMEHRCKNRSETAMRPEINESRFPGSSLRQPFWPRLHFWSIFGSRPAPKMASGTRPERFKSFVKLGRDSKTVPTGSQETPGRLSGGPRAPLGSPGTPFWDGFLIIFEVDFDMKSYSNIIFFAPVFFMGSFAWARDSD